MGFLADAIIGNNTIQGTIPYQGQAQLGSEAQNAYNTQQGITGQQQSFLDALTQNAQGATQGLNTLSGNLQQQAAGGGPNPALNQLNQATGQNVANTAAQIAGSKGINPGLAGRLAAQQGAQIQQQAAGQAGTLGAQQQLAAQNALGNLYNSQIRQTQNQQNLVGGQNLQQQGLLQNALSGQNSQNLAAQKANVSSRNQVLGSIFNALTPFSNAGAGMIGVGGDSSAEGGIADMSDSGVSSLASAFAEGGEAHMAGGGLASLLPLLALLAKGGRVDMKSGGHVPGEAKVKGDSYKNDTIPAVLSPKEIVLPRSVTMSSDAPDKAKKFVEAILNSKGSFGKVVAAKRKMSK
jgi:hypothetical protein